MRTSPLQALSTHRKSVITVTQHSAHSAQRTSHGAGDHLRLARPNTQSTPTNSLTVSGGQERVLQRVISLRCLEVVMQLARLAEHPLNASRRGEAGRPRYWRAILAIMGIPSGRPVNALWPPRTAPPRRGALHTEMNK